MSNLTPVFKPHTQQNYSYSFLENSLTKTQPVQASYSRELNLIAFRNIQGILHDKFDSSVQTIDQQMFNQQS